jgi:endoglucanase
MKRTSLLALFAVALSGASCILQPRPAPLPGTERPKAAPLTHPEAPVKKPPPLVGFMRGMNLGNALEAPKEGEWGVTLDVSHFESYSKAGFDHVRMPVKFSAHASKSAPYTIDASFLARVDWAIDQALSHNLSIIVDLHHYDEMMKVPDEHSDRFLAIWKQIAEHYKSRPKTVAFELINEPNGDQLKGATLNRVLNDGLKVVRATNPDRIVIVDPWFWASAEHLNELDVPTDDANLVATFHCYNPILFTHQGAQFMGPEYQTTGLIFPGPPKKPVQPVPAASKVDWVRRWFENYNAKATEENPSGPKELNDYFDLAQKYFEKTGLRVYLGEFAANDRGDEGSRVRWTRYVREEAERRGYGWAYWDDGGSMKAFNVKSGDWVEPVRDALLH